MTRTKLAIIHHLVVFKASHLNRILQGTKEIEFRLSRTNRSPFRRVARQDVLWLKQTSGPILGKATVARVKFIHPLNPDRFRELKSQAKPTDWPYIESREAANYASIIWLRDICRLAPFSIRKTNSHAWVVLSEAPVH